MKPAQLDMFDMPAPAAVAPVPVVPPAPAPAAAPSADIHWLLAKTKTMNTACGVAVPAFYLQLGTGWSAAGHKIRCTANRYDGTVTCPLCLEEMR